MATSALLDDAVEVVRRSYIDRELTIPTEEGIIDLTVSFDGTWMTLWAGAVARYGGEDTDEYKTWKAAHRNCTINYSGSSGGMEEAAAEQLWKRSIDKFGFRYTTLLPDGDAKTYNQLYSKRVFGGTPIEKEDCVNHVPKRLGTALRKQARRSTVTSGNFDLATLEEPGTDVTKGRGENGSFHRSGNRASFKEEIVECMSKKVHLPIYIDGPFGSSTRDIFDAEHAVLIGGGVGITPYASILQSIMFRYLTMKRTCVKCEHVWYEDMPRELMKVKKVDFIWVNRDQKSFEWFVSLLAQLEMLQTEQGSLGRILDMHLYMTAAKSAADLRGLSLQIALETMQSNEHRDATQGLKTDIQHGRPDWDAVRV
ncbi:hypothetical protein LSAT2_004288 [Lamellibrachia satsuma]|nr:hypothetical protein LSAT2_004288 [Lamellibrachia satsuma]